MSAAGASPERRSLRERSRKYRSFFRIRLQNGMQYRAAALAGAFTQLGWGFMLILVYAAFHKSAAPGQFPMEMQALSSYIWLQQAFLSLLNLWSVESDIFDLITDGNVAYELCRPLDLYSMWFTKAAANRVARAALRCGLVLLVAALLPAPYGFTLPANPLALLLFLCAGLLAFLLVLSVGMCLEPGKMDIE